MSKLRINETSLLRFVRDGWLPLPQSIIPPERPFFLWDHLPAPTTHANPASLLSELYEAVRRLGLDHPPTGRIGVMLSGGIDSGTLLHFMSQAYARNRLIAYTVDFGHYPHEIINSRHLCEKYQIPQRVCPMTLNNHLTLLPETMRNLRSPTDFATQVLPIVRRCERDQVKILVSGLGLDELSGGYPEHVTANAGDFPQVEADLLWRAQSHYAWTQKANAPTLDVRFPFLDPQLIAYCRGLDRSFKCDGNETKILLRDEMQWILPPQIVEAGRRVGTKAGFVPSIQSWWREGLNDWVNSQWHYVPLKYRLRPSTLRSGRNYWRRLRMATVPLFLKMFA